MWLLCFFGGGSRGAVCGCYFYCCFCLHTANCAQICLIFGMLILFTFMDPRFCRGFELCLCAKKALHEIGSQLGLEFSVSANSEIPIQNLALLVNGYS